MTPAIKKLSNLHIKYAVHEYAHDPHTNSYGREVIEVLGVEEKRVFKTLLVTLHGKTKKLAVGVVPVAKQLDLKAFAVATNAKKAAMADPKEAERVTGYVVGGISPLGQKRQLPTVIDDSALEYETVFVSGGKRGLEIQLDPRDLKQLCNAAVADIKR